MLAYRWKTEIELLVHSTDIVYVQTHIVSIPNYDAYGEGTNTLSAQLFLLQQIGREVSKFDACFGNTVIDS